MILFLLVLGIACTGALALAIVQGSGRSSRPFFQQAPEAFGVGAVLLHVSFLLAGWKGAFSFWLLGLLPVILFIIWLWQLRKIISPPSDVKASDETLCNAGGLLFLMLLQLAVIFPAFDLPIFDWDARILWALKAKMLTAEGTVASTFFRDPYLLHIHPRYPLLVPWLTALLSKGSGGFQEAYFRLVILLFSFLTTWQLHQFLARRVGRWGALSLGLVLILSGVWIEAETYLQIEIVLAFFFLSALARLIAWLERERKADLLVAAIFLAGGVMTKNEGFLVALCAVGSLALARMAGPHLKGVAGEGRGGAGRLSPVGLIGTVGLLCLPWLLQRAAIPAVSDENYLQRLTASALGQGVERLPDILIAVTRHFLDWRLWHVFWLLSPCLAGSVLLRWYRTRPAMRLAALIWFAYFAGVLFIYLISPWRDIVLQIDVSFDRVMLPLFPAGLLLVGLWLRGGRGVTCGG